MFDRLPTVLLALAAFACTQVPASAAGTLTLAAQKHAGDQSVDISGTAPAGTTVDLILYGNVSTDIPLVRVNHFDVVSGPSGTYALNVNVAAYFVRGSYLLIQATAADGSTASTRVSFAGVDSESNPTMDGIPYTPF